MQKSPAVRVAASWRRLALAAAAIGFAAAVHATPPPGYATSLAVYRPQSSHLYAYADLTTKAFALDGVFGAPGDIPVAADFDGNGVLNLFDFLAFVNAFNAGC